MKKYDVVVRTAAGELLATLDAEDTIPTGLLLQAVMSHQQCIPHLTQLGANNATTLLVTTPNRLELPPGFTIVFNDGVNINGPLVPSEIPNVPPQFNGVQLTHNLAVLVTYKIDVGVRQDGRLRLDPPDHDDFDDDDTGEW